MKCTIGIEKTRDSMKWLNYTTELQDQCFRLVKNSTLQTCNMTSSIQRALTKLNDEKFEETESCNKYEIEFNNCKIKECRRSNKLDVKMFVWNSGIECDQLKSMLPDNISVTSICKSCQSSCCDRPVYCRLILKDRNQSTSATPQTYAQSMTTTTKSTFLENSVHTFPTTSFTSKSHSSPEMTSSSQTRFQKEVTSSTKPQGDFTPPLTWTQQHTTASSIKRASAQTEGKTDSGVITGGAVGGVGLLVVIALVLLFVFYFRRKSSRNEKNSTATPSFTNSTYNQPQEGVDLRVINSSANGDAGYEESGGNHYSSVQPEQKEKYDYDYVVQSPPSKQTENTPDAVTTNYEFAEPFQQDSNQNYFVLDPQNESESPVNSTGDVEKNYFTLEPDTQSIGDDMYNTLNEGNKGTRVIGVDEYHHLRDVIKHGDEKDLDDYDELHESKHRSHNEIDDDYDHCKPRRDDKFEDDYDHLG